MNPYYREDREHIVVKLLVNNGVRDRHACTGQQFYQIETEAKLGKLSRIV